MNGSTSEEQNSYYKITSALYVGKQKKTNKNKKKNNPFIAAVYTSHAHFRYEFSIFSQECESSLTDITPVAAVINESLIIFEMKNNVIPISSTTRSWPLPASR